MNEGESSAPAEQPSGLSADPDTTSPISTRRLLLRPVAATDVGAVFAILGDPETTAGVSWGLKDRTSVERWVHNRMEQQRSYGLSMWLVERQGCVVGAAGFFPHTDGSIELGYVVHARYWGEGIAPEAVAALLSLIPRHRERIYATIRTTNVASLAVARRVGLLEVDRIEDDRGTLIVMRLKNAGLVAPSESHE